MERPPDRRADANRGSRRDATVPSSRIFNPMASRNNRPPAGAAVLREDITTAIQAAVVAELAAVGYGRLSIEAVARRANVGKTAVYRRWNSKLEMVIEIIADVADQKAILPDTGSLRGDLEIFMRLAAQALRHPLASQIIPDLLAEAARNKAMAEALYSALKRNQNHVTRLLVGRAIKRGEIPVSTDPEMAFDLVIGPLYWHLAVVRNPIDQGYLRSLAAAVAAALSGLRMTEHE